MDKLRFLLLKVALAPLEPQWARLLEIFSREFLRFRGASTQTMGSSLQFVSFISISWNSVLFERLPDLCASVSRR